MPRGLDVSHGGGVSHRAVLACWRRDLLAVSDGCVRCNNRAIDGELHRTVSCWPVRRCIGVNELQLQRAVCRGCAVSRGVDLAVVGVVSRGTLREQCDRHVHELQLRRGLLLSRTVRQCDR